MIDRRQIRLYHGIWGDQRRNWYSSFSTKETVDFPALVEECWHFRETYYCDDLFRVPIPVTVQGKVAFFTGIIKHIELENGTVSQTLTSPLDEKEQIVQICSLSNQKPAKFVELIVASREWLVREYNFQSEQVPYEIINFHALPCKEVPPPPLEIVKNLAGPHKDSYRYSLKDLADATAFWAHRCFVNQLGSRWN